MSNTSVNPDSQSKVVSNVCEAYSVIYGIETQSAIYGFAGRNQIWYIHAVGPALKFININLHNIWYQEFIGT